MPVTFTVADHSAVAVPKPYTVVPLDDFLKPYASKFCSEIWHSSYKQEDVPDLMRRRNGFVDTVIDAYNKHHHLVIRPDDVWIAILSQFNFYVNANAESLRSQFVAHEGQEHIEIDTCNTFGMAKVFADELDKKLLDKTLKNWILAQFSTTTDIDTTIYAIQMMSTLQKYFSYGITMTCGIPSVTLLGEQSDWLNLISRLPKLASFGRETNQWARLLAPVLTRFVEAFDGNPDLDFWGRVVSLYNMGSGPTYLSGWITAFCPWDSNGTWMAGVIDDHKSELVLDVLGIPTQSDPKEVLKPAERHRSISVKNPNNSRGNLIIDGQVYPTIDSEAVPVAHCHVPVRVTKDLAVYDTIMIAGHLASRATGNDGTTIQPAPGWFMFVEDKAREEEVKAELVAAEEHLASVDLSDWKNRIEAQIRVLELSSKLDRGESLYF